MSRIKLPPIEECGKIISEYGMPDNIRRHTEKVRAIANFIAGKISEKGGKPDLELVDRASLMYDFTKMHCIKHGCRHAAEAEKVLAEKGFLEFGEVVKLHGLEEVNNFGADTLLEAKIVWYADKRVNHDELVTLKERYSYLKERYGSKSERKMREILSTLENAEKVEGELFELAGIREIQEANLDG